MLGIHNVLAHFVEDCRPHITCANFFLSINKTDYILNTSEKVF